jgi:hypothetical protein
VPNGDGGDCLSLSCLVIEASWLERGALRRCQLAGPARHHHLVEPHGVLDGFGREAIQRYPPVELVAPRQGAMGERLGEDDHVPGAPARVGHHGLMLLPQGDAPGAREVSLVAASDSAKAATPGWLIGEQELHRQQPRSQGAAPCLVPHAILGKRLTEVEDVTLRAAGSRIPPVSGQDANPARAARQDSRSAAGKRSTAGTGRSAGEATPASPGKFVCGAPRPVCWTPGPGLRLPRRSDLGSRRGRR